MRPNNYDDRDPVWKWPEFIAFAKRLGVDLNAFTQKLTIELTMDEYPVIKQECLGEDTSKNQKVA